MKILDPCVAELSVSVFLLLKLELLIQLPDRYTRKIFLLAHF